MTQLRVIEDGGAADRPFVLFDRAWNGYPRYTYKSPHSSPEVTIVRQPYHTDAEWLRVKRAFMARFDHGTPTRDEHGNAVTWVTDTVRE